jgi:integrase
VIKTNPQETQTIEGVEHGATIALILDRGPANTPYTLRHTAAMRLLRAPTPVDTATIALWLGHETLDSTNKYLHSGMELRRPALTG